MKLLSAEQMRRLDRRAIEEIGIPGAVLMENAGRGAAEVICARYGDLFPGPVLVVAGKGNNGGDGYVIARHLLDRGWQVRTVVLSPRDAIGGDAQLMLQVLLNLGGDICFAADAATLAAVPGAGSRWSLVVDALLGTGLTSAVEGLYAQGIAMINACGVPVVAVDIPSGIDAGSGCIHGTAVRADLTVTFAAAKLGHAVYPGAGLVGMLEVVDIGIPAGLVAQVRPAHLLVEDAEGAALLPPRPATGHKGTFGHALIVAGSRGKSGAAAMAAQGALRSGAGLVTVACPATIQQVLDIKLTEAMTAALPDLDGMLSLQGSEDLRLLWQDKQVVALGPGLGQGPEIAPLVRKVVRDCPLPLVIDADGLNALVGAVDDLSARSGRGTVLTPHPGEMARLLGATIPEVEADRLGIATTFARRYQVVLVLKGARTVIACPDGALHINGSGNPGLASGGMGDVLTGLIAGLIGQGLCPEAAATLGVYLHGAAADRLCRHLGTAGMLASDLLAEVPATRNALHPWRTSYA